GLGLQTAGVAGVAVDALRVHLVAAHHDLVGVDHDHVVAGVDVGGEDRLVLAAQDAGDLGGEPAEDQALGVDHVPLTLDLAGFGGVRLHAIQRPCAGAATSEFKPGNDTSQRPASHRVPSYPADHRISPSGG